MLEPESRIADVGGGTGRYAEWLVEHGHAVELLDPVPLHIEQATARAAGRFGTHVGDARALPYDDASFDAVLLFGPLYHLSARDDRLLTLREASRVCRSGGIVAATVISRYAGLLDHLKGGRIADPAVFVNVMAQTVNGRRVPPEHRIGVFPDAYFHLPQELADEFEEAGLGTADIYAVQGLGWLATEFLELWADPVGQAHVLEIAERFEREPSVQAISPHLLAVGTKP
ncbi:MAG TPA: class I SAM-dependent methyltransferase [Gaiellaceae bacterium]|nr:class I SAM-dependent methyltransferase [Gaiellaceae bacterium]